MPRPTSRRPTDGELAILKILWKEGGRSVRKIRRELEKEGEVTNQSILRRLQIMIEKGYIKVDDSDRPQIYHAVVTEGDTKRRLISDMIARAFGGSAKDLVLHALKSKKTSAEELAEIQKRLNQLKGGRQ